MQISDYREKIPFLMLHLHRLWQYPKQNHILSHFLKRQVGILLEEAFLTIRSFMTLFLVSANKRLNEDSLLILNFFFIAFMLGWKTIFSIMEPIVSFLDDTEVCSGQLKRFNKSVMIRNNYWKLKQHLFVLITIYPFQAALHFLVYCYFYLTNMVYMLSKMVWKCNQYLVHQSTVI